MHYRHTLKFVTQTLHRKRSIQKCPNVLTHQLRDQLCFDSLWVVEKNDEKITQLHIYVHKFPISVTTNANKVVKSALHR